MGRISVIFVLFWVTIISLSNCTFTKKIKDGEMAFDRKQYAVAIKMLSDEFERLDYPELKARKAFLIAESYAAINKVPESIEWYKSAFDLRYGDKALEQLAYALKKNEQYKEAIAVFRALQERVGNSLTITTEINECTNAVDWLEEAKTSPLVVEKIKHNSSFTDYAPVIFENGQLVISSDRKNARYEEQYNWTGNWFSDLYIISDELSEPLPMDMNINSAHNEGSATFNTTFTEIIFTRCQSDFDDDYCKLMISSRQGNGWSEPEVLPFIQDRTNYVHPNLHQSDSILFFSAEIESGFGGYDIYYVERLRSGWGQPQVLGSGVNTGGNENFPFIYEDTLYFASDGWAGMGGFDIFKTYVQDDGSWTRVENLKPPINSGADDISFIIDIVHRKTTGEFTGYFASSRKGSESDDIYRFRSEIVEDIPEEVITEDTDKDKQTLRLYLAVRTQEKTFLIQDDPQSGETGKQNLNDVSIEVMSSAGEVKKLNTGSRAFLVMDINPQETYVIKAAKDQYLSATTTFKPSAIPEFGEKTYNINLLLEKIFLDREILLENIYYDFNESFIRDDAKPSLNNLANLLKENPEIKIQLFSHTDCRGEEDFNIRLSQARAQAAVDYLVSVGIAPERMTATGLGETRPAINCYCETCTEEEHQENRRTTFKIVSY